MNGYIYIIRNKINSKVYIGQTTQRPKDRWKDHKSKSKYKNNVLYKAIRKYGIDNFYMNIIEDNVPYEKLSEREIFWIEKYDSYKNGYNMTIGGEGNGRLEVYKIHIVTMENSNDFENAMNDYLDDGYKVESSSCNSRYYKAILVLKEDE